MILYTRFFHESLNTHPHRDCYRDRNRNRDRVSDTVPAVGFTRTRPGGVRRRVLLFASLSTLTAAFQSLSAADQHVHDLEPYTVSASLVPRPQQELVAPARVLADEALEDAFSATLGDLLKNQPGVHATAFGAGSSRPVIRGFDGPRVRILENGLDSGDVSETSPDHAVGLEPFFIQSVEILRGPSTIGYGSSAIGGVVNINDRRIPRINREDGLSGSLFSAYDSVHDGWTGAALATVNTGDLAFTVGALTRQFEDYDIPGYAEIAELREEYHEDNHEEEHEEHEEDEHGEEEPEKGSLGNSFVDTDSFSLAGTWFPSAATRLSIATFYMDQLYGVPGHAHAHEDGHEEEEDHAHEEEHEEMHEEDEEFVRIDLKQRRTNLEFSHQLTDGWFESLQVRASLSDYKHRELEGAELGTSFERDTWEARLEGRYTVDAAHPGLLGLHLTEMDFNAQGEEAFTPPSRTRDFAIFALQEWNLDSMRLEGGIRAEHRSIDADSQSDYRAWATSLSAGAYVPLSDAFSLALSASRSQRHPTSTELMADGPHAATRQVEIGDPTLQEETATGVDVALRWNAGRVEAEVTAFLSRFSDYIYAEPTGLEEDGLPVFQYRSADATFHGLESSLTLHLHTDAARITDLSVMLDFVETDLDGVAGELPRIPPARVGLGFLHEQDQWRFSSSAYKVFEQNDTAINELPTDGYVLWNARLSYSWVFENHSLQLSLAAENLLDEEIRLHTSTLKDLAPMPGRNVSVSMRLDF
jgi:iron complex outermembrane receptor protein